MMSNSHDPGLGGDRREVRPDEQPRLGGKAVLKHLLEGLGHESARVRARAALQLKNFTTEELPALLETLRSGNDQARVHVSELLQHYVEIAVQAGQQVDPGLTAHMIQALETDRELTVRARAARTLQALQDPTALPALIAALKDPDAYMRIEAIHAASGIGGPDVFPALLEMLNDESAEVQRQAINALAKTADPRALPHLRRRLNSPITDVERAAIHALGKLRDPEALDAIIARLQHFPYYGVVSFALRGYGATAVPGLLKLVEDGDNGAARSAARALGIVKHSDAVPGLLDLFDRREPAVTAEIAETLGRLKDVRAVPVLVDALQHDDPGVKVRCIEALGRIGAQEAIQPVNAILRHDPEWVMRSTAARALALIGSAEAEDGLIAALGDTYHAVRDAAAAGLGRLRTRAAIAALIDVLDDEDNNVRARAAQALGKIKAIEAVPALIELLDDGGFSPYVMPPTNRDDVFTGATVEELAAWALQEIGTEEALAALESWVPPG